MIRNGNVMKISKKAENAQLEKNCLSQIFTCFFFSNCQIVIAYKVSTLKKAKNVLYIFLKSDQKRILT
jgi:hypothetical protein